MGSTPRPWEAAPAPWGDPEIEELPAQPVLASGQGRPGLTAAAAGGVLVIILAAGLGVLGGRPTPSPTSPAFAAASPATPAAPPTAAAPLVTPAVPCLPLARSLPEVRLIVGELGSGEERGIVGARNVFEWTQPSAQPAPALVLEQPGAGRTELRSDVLAELRIVGDVCASAWTIELARPNDTINLEDFGGAPGDEGFGTQNRFELDLGRYRGRDYDLHAVLTFPEVTMRTTWPIRILPFDLPSAQLTVADQDLDIVPGCDIRLVLDTGYTELANPCFADFGRLPKTASIHRPGPPLVFRFPAGWSIEAPTVTCGRIAERHFEVDPSCVTGWSDEGTSLSILGPSGTESDDEDTWTLAINACGVQQQADLTNSACGTWYATVRLRISTR